MTYPKGYTPPIKRRDGTYPKGYVPPPNATIAPSQNNDRVEIRYVEDGNIKSAVIDPWSTGLYNGESLLWNYSSNTKGIIRKKVTARMMVTNFRAFHTDEENHRVAGYALLYAIDDVIVMNTRRISDSVGYAVYAGRYSGFAGPRFSSGTSKTVGDLVFIINGQQATWGNIPDPNGLKSFIKSIKKTMYDPLTKLEQKKSRGGTICSQCGIQNPRSARFCSGCGTQLLQMCSNCKQRNPIGASFCNKCGSQLSISYTISVDKPTFSDKGDSEVVEPSFREYILSEYNIKIKYPSTWTKKDDNQDPYTKVMFQSPIEDPADQLHDSVLSVCVDDTVGNMTLDTFIEGNITGLRQSSSDFKLIESTPTTLSGIPARQIVYSGSYSGSQRKILWIATVKGNIAYWVTYLADPNRYLRFLSSAEQMISSFEILY